MNFSHQFGPAEGLDSDADMMQIRGDWFPTAKTLADFGVASALLVVVAPLILLLMLMVKATSRGPTIFSQVRLGRDGRPFRLFKIRSMAHNCEGVTGPQWAKAKDPRATTLGRFLRASHLDELPQLWNVIRGDMSLIGPRPERPEFVVKLEREIPDYRKRLAIAPGITGLAQIQLPPDSDLDDVRRKVACDLCYIERLGPGLDLKILLGTTLKVLGLPLEATSRLLGLPGVDSPAQTGATRSAVDSGALAQLQSV